MQRFSRRLGIAALSTALVAGAFGTTQAGIIPWLYDGVFGLNYGGYPMSYSAGYSAGYSPCGPAGCGVACSPCGSSPCSTGRCSSRTSNYSGCEVACTPSCNATSTWKADSGPKKAEVRTEIRSNSPTSTVPRENFSTPRTRTNPTYVPDDDEVGTEILKKPVNNGGAARGFGPTPPAAGGLTPAFGDDTGLGDEPAIKVKPAAPAGNLPPQGEAARPLNLDNKATWTVSPTTASLRTTRPLVLRDAKIARRTTDVPTTPVATSGSTSIVKK